MLRLSKLADYGTVVMVYLAQHTEGLHNAREIASETHLQQPTVSKLLKLLTSYGLLQSKQGAQGGYSLALAADQISVADVIVAVEGKQGLTECSEHPGNCSLESVCTISEHWRVIDRAVYAALNSVKLSDLTQSKMPVINVIPLLESEMK